MSEHGILVEAINRVAFAIEKQNEIQEKVYFDYERRHQENIRMHEENLKISEIRYNEQNEINVKMASDINEVKELYKKLVEGRK